MSWLKGRIFTTKMEEEQPSANCVWHFVGDLKPLLPTFMKQKIKPGLPLGVWWGSGNEKKKKLIARKRKV